MVENSLNLKISSKKKSASIGSFEILTTTASHNYKSHISVLALAILSARVGEDWCRVCELSLTKSMT